MIERGAKRIRALLAAAGLTMVAATASGCSTARSTIDSKSAAQQITNQLKSRYHTSQVTVTCPSGVRADQGRRFSCAATIEGEMVDMDAVVTGSNGQFTVTPAHPIIEVASVAAQLETEIAQKAGLRPAVRCPQKPVLVVPVGQSFECYATFAEQPPRSVTVTIVDARGDFGFQLAAAAG